MHSACLAELGEAMLRRRIELQLRLIQALYAESMLRDSNTRAIFIERAEPILDSTEAAIINVGLEADDELRELLRSVRREIAVRRD
jgi:hypothetical protein